MLNLKYKGKINKILDITWNTSSGPRDKHTHTYTHSLIFPPRTTRTETKSIKDAIEQVNIKAPALMKTAISGWYSIIEAFKEKYHEHYKILYGYSVVTSGCGNKDITINLIFTELWWTNQKKKKLYINKEVHSDKAVTSPEQHNKKISER